MSFAKYQKTVSRRGISAKTIGVTVKGRFAFYKPVIEKFFKECNFVELFYDAENHRIGILPLQHESPDALRIQGKTTKMIIAKKFLNRFKIAVEDRRYEFTVENNMLVISLT